MNVYSGDTEFRTSVATFNGAAKGLRAHWSAELDYRFVKTLAEHTICNEQDGIVFKHKYADSDIIEDVTRDIANKKPIQAIVHDLAIKFPNKIEQHRSRECIELLLTLQGIIPEFNFQQINNKHINMWTRVIVPFRQVFDCGTLYKGKSMLHKDCKRFTKAIMEFITSVSSKGINNVDYNIFRKPGKGSKLLEQWMTAMLHTHKMDMVKFLIACGARLAFTYLKSRPADSLTFNEQNYLKTASHSPKEILVVLKSYMDDIIRQENIDSLADLGVVSEIMRESPQSFHNQGSVYSGHQSPPPNTPAAYPQPSHKPMQHYMQRHYEVDSAARYHECMRGYSPAQSPGCGPAMPPGYPYQPHRYPEMSSPRAPSFYRTYQAPMYEHRQHPSQWPPEHPMQQAYHAAGPYRQYPANPMPPPSSARYHPYAQHPMANANRSQGYQRMRPPMYPSNVTAYASQRMHCNMPSIPSQHPQQGPLNKRESGMFPIVSRNNSIGSGTHPNVVGERRGSVQLAPVSHNGFTGSGAQHPRPMERQNSVQLALASSSNSMASSTPPNFAGERRGSVQLAPVPVNTSKTTDTQPPLIERKGPITTAASSKPFGGRRSSVQLAPIPTNCSVEAVSQKAIEQSIVQKPQSNPAVSTPEMRSAISHMDQATSTDSEVAAGIQAKAVSAPVTPNLNTQTKLAARSASASSASKETGSSALKKTAVSGDTQQDTVSLANGKSSQTSSDNYHHPASIVSLLSR
ncbi:hypothetical protein BX667DRAFT_520284 [Coemansia mojavensis]|nr:hypothetical protein BX667DRAFT_520284 [Coemansia mojavensis]